MKNNAIIFYGTLAERGKLPIGGGEVGNARTLKLLRDSGYKVIEIPKYKKHPKGSNKIMLLLSVLLNYVKYFLTLIKFITDKPVVHVSGFYGNVIRHELLLIITAKALRYKVVYELRGGGAINFYNIYGEKYQKEFSKALNKADHIFTQGQENIPLIRLLTKGKNIFYYPNYVLNGFAPDSNYERDMAEIKLIYFGRLAEQKNIEMIIDVLHLLELDGTKGHLTLIGQCTSDKFKQKIAQKIAQLKLVDHCTIIPGCQHEELKKHLTDKHFFIFPTNEHREGHSNALTEAMAFGIVPIASKNGFNKSVINNDMLLCKDFTAKEYSDKIVNVLNGFNYQELSNSCYTRVANHYSEIIMRNKLDDAYKRVFSSC